MTKRKRTSGAVRTDFPAGGHAITSGDETLCCVGVEDQPEHIDYVLARAQGVHRDIVDLFKVPCGSYLSTWAAGHVVIIVSPDRVVATRGEWLLVIRRYPTETAPRIGLYHLRADPPGGPDGEQVPFDDDAGFLVGRAAPLLLRGFGARWPEAEEALEAERADILRSVGREDEDDEPPDCSTCGNDTCPDRVSALPIPEA
jgi:hypothetical protein